MLVTDIIKAITNASGMAKEVIIAQHAENYDFLDVLTHTYEPLWTYGIKKFPWIGKGTETLESTYDEWRILLVKLKERVLTGDTAKSIVGQYVSTLTPKDATLFKYILTKDLRAGIGSTTINKVIPGHVSVFAFMKAKVYQPGMIAKTGPLYMSLKIDCIRGLLRYGTLYSSGGKVITGVQHIVQNLPRSLELDGEITIPGLNFDSASGKIRSSHQCPTAIFNVFDVSSNTGSFEDRLAELKYLEAGVFLGNPFIKVIKHSLAKDDETIFRNFEKALSAGYEGLVCKTPQHKYQLKRSADWLKVKAEDPEDGIIRGFNWGTGKNADTYSTITVERPNGVLVKVGGLKESMMDYFKQNADRLIGKHVSYKYHQETPDGSLRHPRFFRERWDKDAL